jgi:hypothetical protein
MLAYVPAGMHAGSSTACIMCLNGAQLMTANLGDSGFLVVRDGNLIFSSPQQQHRFNFPFQVGTNGDPVSACQVRMYNVYLMLRNKAFIPSAVQCWVWWGMERRELRSKEHMHGACMRAPVAKMWGGVCASFCEILASRTRAGAAFVNTN